MTEGTIAMTQKAVDQLGVVQQVVSRQLRQREAARQLGLSVRPIKRLMARYRAEGASGLVSRRLGRRPVRRRSPGGAGTGPHPLSRLRPHAGPREAGRPPRAQALCRDAAPVDDRRRAMEAQGTQVGSHSSAASGAHAARVGASWCRSTAHTMTGSRVAVHAAP